MSSFVSGSSVSSSSGVGGGVPDLMSFATIASQVGRPEETIQYVIEGATRLYETNPDSEITGAERSLFVKNLKQVVNQQRTSVKRLMEEIDMGSGNINEESGARELELTTEYLECKALQLRQTCMMVVDAVRDIFLPMASSAESRVFFNKLAGDHARYLCENNYDDGSFPDLANERYHWIEEAEMFYQSAYEESQSDLSPIHPVRLSLILNFAIFYYEIKRETDKACEFAKTAYDDAAAELGIDPSLDSPNNSESGSRAGTASNSGTKAFDLVSESEAPQEPEATKILKIIKTSLKRWTKSQQSLTGM